MKHKYRAWDIKQKRMWQVGLIDFIDGTADVYDYEFCENLGREGKVSNFRLSIRNDIILMQFTGLHDKKRTDEYPIGQEIFDNDIYKDVEGIISVVKMAVDGWALFPVEKGTPVQNLYWHNVCNKTNGEVIGNRHSNPELIET